MRRVKRMLAAILALPLLCANSPAPGAYTYDIGARIDCVPTEEGADAYTLTITNSSASGYLMSIDDGNVHMHLSEELFPTVNGFLLLPPGESITAQWDELIEPGDYEGLGIDSTQLSLEPADPSMIVERTYDSVEEATTISFKGSLMNPLSLVSYQVGLAYYRDDGLLYVSASGISIPKGESREVECTFSFDGEAMDEDLYTFIFANNQYYDDYYNENHTLDNLGDHPELIAAIVAASIFVLALIGGTIWYVVAKRKNDSFIYHPDK